MNLQQLYYFRKLAEVQHYTEAAKALYITQPSLSDSIASLEHELSVSLFQKKGRGVQLTKYGQEFYEYVNQALGILEHGIAAVREKSDSVTGTIDIGCIPTLLGDFLPNALDLYRDPKADKFDPMVIFGFSILGGHSKKIIPYLYKERKKPLRAQVGKNVISFSQAEFTKLPKYMLESERIKFSTEQRQLLLSPEKKPSKFFLRWVNDAIFPDSIKEKMEEIKNR